MTAHAAAGLHNAMPALPVKDVRTAAADYEVRLGFTIGHLSDDIAILSRDDVVLQLWAASDASWSSRSAASGSPVRSGAESFLAGTASCRIQVRDVDALHAELEPRGVLHPSHPHVASTDFGTRELHALDLDGNLLTFVLWTQT
ncbi:Bleomycin resistance protein [Paraconexibacter sp. AEG42_29]|uniref:Bleomycin resistance protein n=1 Tax=Paraconexibacter sp. AEG42_29 TaxID=2997339 RepID=A0AAU7AW90_9ACTN